MKHLIGGIKLLGICIFLLLVGVIGAAYAKSERDSLQSD